MDESQRLNAFPQRDTNVCSLRVSLGEVLEKMQSEVKDQNSGFLVVSYTWIEIATQDVSLFKEDTVKVYAFKCV